MFLNENIDIYFLIDLFFFCTFLITSLFFLLDQLFKEDSHKDFFYDFMFLSLMLSIGYILGNIL